MSNNTERLERMAVERDCAAERLDVACKGDAWALNCCGGDSLRSEAAFLRSLIPLVEAGERAMRPSETLEAFVRRIDRETDERQAKCPHPLDDWRSFEDTDDWSRGWCCKCGKHITQPLPAPSAEGGAG